MRSAAAAILILALLLTPFVWAQVDLHYALQPSSEPEPAHPTIVMLGDSHTQIANWRMLTGCANIANYGVGGNTSAQMLARLSPVLEVQPRLVFIMAGTNDVSNGMPAAETSRNVDAIKAALKARGIDALVVAAPVRADGKPLPDVGADIAPNFTAANLLADGIHLHRSGYAKWAAAISTEVARYCHR